METTAERRERVTRAFKAQTRQMGCNASPRLVYSGSEPVEAMRVLRAAGFRGMSRDGDTVVLYCAPDDDARATAAGNAMLDAGIVDGICW